MSATSILSGSTAGLNLLEGIFGMNAADAQAGSLRSQLSLVRAESEADIVRYAESASDFRAKQKLAYLKSGVTLEGSPLEILDETVRVSSENISAMRAKTTADILSAESKISALRGQGRAALVGGISKAALAARGINFKGAPKKAASTNTGFDTSTGAQFGAGPSGSDERGSRY